MLLRMCAIMCSSSRRNFHQSSSWKRNCLVRKNTSVDANFKYFLFSYRLCPVARLFSICGWISVFRYGCFTYSTFHVFNIQLHHSAHLFIPLFLLNQSSVEHSAHLRVKGVDHVDHPISQELERVKLYMKKVIQIRQAQETVSEGGECN